jgi:hypothetical protein
VIAGFAARLTALLRRFRGWTLVKIEDAKTEKTDAFMGWHALDPSSPCALLWTFPFYLRTTLLRWTEYLLPAPLALPAHPLSFCPSSRSLIRPLLLSLSRLLALLSTMTCIPPYHPCPGHESTTEHDQCAQCLYYVVFEGFVRGIYTNS